MAKNKREFDLVVYGATGFTGRLACEYLCHHADATKLKWAIAGRDSAKLASLLDDLNALNGVSSPQEIVVADSSDWDSLESMTSQARVVLTTVGPYMEYGEPLVEACVAQGTDYIDITGEPAFVRATRDQFHHQAEESGALIISCCGFDSIPADLGVLFVRQLLPANESVRVRSYVKAKGSPSGGTWASIIRIMSDGDARRAPSSSRSTGARSARVPAKPRLHRCEERGSWVFPMPVVDPAIVRHSARTRGDYGPDFHYEQYYETRSLWGVGALAVGAAGMFLMSQFKPTRDFLLNQKPSGTGPSEAQRADGFFRVDLIAESGDKRVEARVSGGDPGYTETAKMVVESALTLACDRAKLRFQGGVLTPASALGAVLVERLKKAGISFEQTAG